MEDRPNIGWRRGERPGPTGTAGVTLMELMVVITLVVALLGAGAYSMGLITQTNFKNEVRRLTSAIKYTWSRAAMNNAQYRMVFDLDANSYHTEVTDAPVVAQSNSEESESSQFVSEEARRAQEREREEAEADQTTDSPFNVDKKPTFQQVKAAELAPHKFPGEIRIVEVIPCNQSEPVESGRAAIHFYPNGFQQPAIIVLRFGEEGRFYSLKTEPLTGRVQVFSKRIDTTEDCGKPEEVQEEW